MNNKGILVVISGFSGAGKGTIMGRLIENYRDKYSLSISATTRKPRPGEVDGKSYFFVDTDKFESMISENELIEYAQYVGNYYGTPKAYVEEQLAAGKNVILEIEIQGALKVREKFPDTKLIFVSAPSAEVLRDRLVGRGTEATEVVEARLSRAYEESLGIEEYNYFVVNDDLEECVALMDKIITNEREGNAQLNEANLVTNNIDFINKTRKELLGFSKGE